jgi:hypothetical protein
MKISMFLNTYLRELKKALTRNLLQSPMNYRKLEEHAYLKAL